MIRRTSALLARLVLVLAVFGMGIPAPALMRCLTGPCPLPCCTPPAKEAAPKNEAKPKTAHSCCASKKPKAQHEITSHDSCSACKCEVRSGTPAVAKKLDSAFASPDQPVMAPPVALALSVDQPAICEQVIFATDSSPPIVRPHMPDRGRAPPVVG